MDEQKQKVKDFLKKYDMYYGDVDIQGECGAFLEEMERGLCAQPSSLKMIPTFIETGRALPVNQPIIVMDVGGTNLRVAVVSFDSSEKPLIEHFKRYPTPGSDHEISSDEFFDKLASYLEPVLDRSAKIGVCFSYPAAPLENKDGRVIQMTKQVRVRDIEGKVVGEEILKALRKRGIKDDKQFVIINDSVATLFGCKTEQSGRKFATYVGFILGTGTNTAYIENNSRIKKISHKNPGGNMVINIESGGYAGFKGGIFDRQLDHTTADRGEYLYEKMVAGRYQGALLELVLKKAAEDGLFSKETAARIASLEHLESFEADRFLFYPYADNRLAKTCAGEADRIALCHLIDALNERSARLVTVNLRAVLMKTGLGTNPALPVCITADGSTFYGSKGFRDKVAYYMKKHVGDELGICYDIVRAENATLVGTAFAALIN